ncbi:hypothetical protein GUITHDRAFT_113994 [Guillardia theta CCMP2712]|uniref:tRNA pseudouridine synthase n=1 Tax=Guillardia theta (strain CCMP2712) TaxID=905079 RepID=L1IVY1_GUITC|nr:hypothetical protein GUITHDRAFT_113994 [Guillardia theta CCMP2712]EKX40000.1 hypothetical protein GUITHDRAFT_113994 [Guillardia theta CCMP2712]|eukprot:XP_005826980.1 hypothetical protein GUITHDRAFT_113994 [Guillardia theta CCMP2712]
MTGQERFQDSLNAANMGNNATASDDSDLDKTFRYRCNVMYDGTNYNGFQLQHYQPSIQGLLETVLSRKLQRRTRVVGAGRTDSGVHSRGQVVHFDSSENITDLQKFQHGMNLMLPLDVKICGLEHVQDLDFVPHLNETRKWHAIYSARKKLYSYRIFIGKVQDPITRHSRHHEYRNVDLDLLREVAAMFEGTHDFSAFSNTRGDNSTMDTVRTIYRVGVVFEGEGNVRLDFELDGALYKMVRNIVGTILAVGGTEETFQWLLLLMDSA